MVVDEEVLVSVVAVEVFVVVFDADVVLVIEVVRVFVEVLVMETDDDVIVVADVERVAVEEDVDVVLVI